MRLIHCADLHIDSNLRTYLTEEEANARKNEILNNFPRLIQYATQNNINKILIAGDLFDADSVSRHAENVVYNAILGNPRIMFYYVPGNHDENNFLVGNRDLPKNIVVFDEKLRKIPLNDAGTIVLYSLKLTEENYKSFYDYLNFDESKFNILMLHGEERAGGSANFEECIDFGKLKNKGIDYLALGHIHKRITMPLDERGMIVYPGCLEGRGFDECGEHGFYVADINEEILNVAYTFVPFAHRRMIELDVPVTGVTGTTDIAERIQNSLDKNEIDPDDFLKIVLCGKTDVFADKNLDYLLVCFKETAKVVKIVDKTSPYVDYDSYKNDMSLKGEYIRLVQNADLSDTDKACIIKMGIDALMGEKS